MFGIRSAHYQLGEDLVQKFDEHEEAGNVEPFLFDVFKKNFPFGSRSLKREREVAPIAGQLRTHLRKKRPMAFSIKVTARILSRSGKLLLPQSETTATGMLPHSRNPGTALLCCNRDRIPESMKPLLKAAVLQRTIQIRGQERVVVNDAQMLLKETPKNLAGILERLETPRIEAQCGKDTT